MGHKAHGSSKAHGRVKPSRPKAKKRPEPQVRSFLSHRGSTLETTGGLEGVTSRGAKKAGTAIKKAIFGTPKPKPFKDPIPDAKKRRKKT